MITISFDRFENGRSPWGPTVRHVQIGEALMSLAKNELGFLAKVRVLSPVKIVVETPILGKIDVTEFEGTADEMRPLFELVSMYVEISQSHHRERVMAKVFEKMNKGGANTLLLVNLGPILAGESFVKMATLLLLEVQEPAQLERLAAMPFPDLLSIYQLSRENPDIDIATLIALAA